MLVAKSNMLKYHLKTEESRKILKPDLVILYYLMLLPVFLTLNGIWGGVTFSNILKSISTLFPQSLGKTVNFSTRER